MKNSKQKRIFLTCIIPLTITFILAISCSKNDEERPQEEAEILLKQTEELRVKQQERRSELNEMSMQQIVNRVKAESDKRVEPFNSMAYSELVSRGPDIVQGLKISIIEGAYDHTSLLPMLALREINRDEYNSVEAEIRIAILIRSLGTSEYFNLWGIPHLNWESAADAIIEHGELALKALIPLLENTSSAPVWGSEEVLEYRKYQYRICDYAMAFVNTINQREIEIPINPEARDKIIREMILELQ